MTTGPQRISDTDLFATAGAAAPPAAPPAAAVTLDAAKAVLAALCAAGLQPPFGFDLDNAEQLWAVQLHGYPFDVLMEAAQSYIEGSEQRELPTVGQINAVARVIQAERLRSSATKQRTTGSCPCGGQVPAWVEHTEHVDEVIGEHGEVLVREHTRTWRTPCPICMPDVYDWHAQGHANPGHDRMGCSHELCRPRRTPTTSKARRAS